MTGWLVATALAGVALWLSRRLGVATSDLKAAEARYRAAERRAEGLGHVATLDDDDVRSLLSERVRAARGDLPPAVARDDSDGS
ncbi:MAG: hypothetical protein MJH10_10095 [Epibacterium sp.]|nr:hypothetical protein [Epibacterium sp.]NQX73888.1 hypothetical protein [Epibacterium sp.]